MALFEIENLTFTYPDAPAPTLDGVDAVIEQGSFVVICGRSGCGKSTLLRHFKTALTPFGARSGQIRFSGRPLGDVSVLEQASSIGYVLQDPDAQIVTDKVWHELAFGLEGLGVDSDAIRLRVAEMASFFGIQDWFHRDVEELSGGQKQMLNLASVMAMQPAALVLDEPTSQLDPIAARDFLSAVRKINEELGVTVIMVEHRLEDVLPMADLVIVLEGGKVRALGTPREVGASLAGSDLFASMPVPMRIHEGVQGGGPCPLTVREGRSWLEGRYGEIRAARPGEVSCPGEVERPGDAACSGEPAHPEDVDACGGCAGGRAARPVHLRARRASEAREAPALSCKDVWFRYERDEPDVVRGLSLEVRRGEIFCLMGGNGTGKSTTLSILSGQLSPYRGRVRLGGKDVSRGRSVTERARLAVLPQNPQCLFVEDTVRADLEEMFHGRRLIDAAERERRIARVVEQTAIGHLLDMHPYDLSGGERQRAALAKILLLEPSILLLDEPTKGLDGMHKEQLAAVLDDLAANGAAILMVTHDIEFSAAHADRCALFFDGSVATVKGTHDFFCGNSFYTTAANRMARSVFPDAVTAQEVIEACKEADSAR